MIPNIAVVVVFYGVCFTLTITSGHILHSHVRCCKYGSCCWLLAVEKFKVLPGRHSGSQVTLHAIQPAHIKSINLKNSITAAARD